MGPKKRSNTFTVDESRISEDESAEESVEIKRRTKRGKLGVAKVTEMDFSIGVIDNVANVGSSNSSSWKVTADSVYNVEDNLDLTEELLEKVRERRSKAKRRRKGSNVEINMEDFSGIELSSGKSDDSVFRPEFSSTPQKLRSENASVRDLIENHL